MSTSSRRSQAAAAGHIGRARWAATARDCLLHLGGPFLLAPLAERQIAADRGAKRLVCLALDGKQRLTTGRGTDHDEIVVAMLAAKIVEPSDVLGDRELGLEGSCELVAIEQGDELRRQGRTVTIIEPSACELERAPAWFPVLFIASWAESASARARAR